jgi:Predicted oxidoreductases (related to aryl-alcohol dehydrogenases)
VPEGSRAALPRMAWLAEGLTDKARNAVVVELEKIARDLGCSVAQLSIAWCVTNPNVSSVITGASRVEQVTENMKALDVVPKLTPDVVERIEKLVEGRFD